MVLDRELLLLDGVAVVVLELLLDVADALLVAVDRRVLLLVTVASTHFCSLYCLGTTMLT